MTPAAEIDAVFEQDQLRVDSIWKLGERARAGDVEAQFCAIIAAGVFTGLRYSLQEYPAALEDLGREVNERRWSRWQSRNGRPLDPAAEFEAMGVTYGEADREVLVEVDHAIRSWEDQLAIPDEEVEMVTKAKAKEGTTQPLPAWTGRTRTGYPSGATLWVCPVCDRGNEMGDTVCKCDYDRVAEPPRIPESQGEAAAKEAAVGGRMRTIKVEISKTTGFEAELYLVGAEDRYRVGWTFRGKGTSSIQQIPIEPVYECEEAAAAAGFERLREWVLKQPDSPKRRKALAETEIHKTRVIGQWLRQQQTGSIDRTLQASRAAAAAPAMPPVPLADRVNGAPVEQLDLARIQPSPENMRTDFDEASLQELADSIKSHGLGQPIMVVAAGKGWELIAGERRYRASKLAGLKSIPSRVVDCSPAEARELRLIENLKRKDLSAIEEARGYQTLLHENGYTQKALGEKLGVDQSTIANRIRLLRLPPALQELIIRREILESHGRQLVTYVEIPTVLDHFAKAIKEQIRDEGLPSLRDWTGWLHSTACEVLREVEPKTYYSYREGGQYFSGQVQFTEKHLEQWKDELQIVELKDPYSKRTERYAANLKRWKELHGPLAKAAIERQSARNAGGEKKTASKDPKAEPTAAELAARKKEQAEQLAKKVASYRNRWLQQRCSAACPQLRHEQGIKLLIGFAGMTDRDRRRLEDLMAAIKEVGGKAVTAQHQQRPMLSVLALPDDKVLAVAKAALGRWLAQPVEDYGIDLHAADLPAIAQLLDVDVARDWRVDEEFLLLHTKDQLRDLFGEWKLSGPLMDKRTDIIQEVLQCHAKDRLPAPKSLLKGGK